MSEHRTPEMRGGSHAERTRRRVIAGATVIGAIAAVIAIGALIAGTFPKPSAEPSTSVASAPGSLAAQPAATASTSSTVAAAATTMTPSPAKHTAKKKAVAKSAKKAPPRPVVPPLGMARTLPGSTEMIVATGAQLGAKDGALRIFDLSGGVWREVLSATCRFGTNGLVDGTKRVQGSRTTPTGIWYAGSFVWGWHPTAPAGTKMPYRQTTKNVWWSAEPGSTYNTWVESSQHVTGEHLVDVKVQYEFALSTGYNSPPNEVVEGRGTAIFLHVFDPPDYHGGYTAGCVALSRADMLRVFATLDPSRRPTFAIGTDTPGTATSIAAY